MSTSSSSNQPGFGLGGQGFGAQGLGSIFEALEGLRDSFGGLGERVGSRMGRGDVRTAILALLLEGPMHGYQIIREIETRSKGVWKPSPGSVYPTLQLLADEGLVSAEEEGDRKTYALTEAGREVAGAADGSLPWETPTFRHAEKSTALPKAGAKLAQAAMQVQRGGTPEQVEQAVTVIDDARRKLYAILAED